MWVLSFSQDLFRFITMFVWFKNSKATHTVVELIVDFDSLVRDSVWSQHDPNSV